MDLPPSLVRAAPRLARLALGAAFLSGIASRFGLWGKGVGYGSFERFEQYTAEACLGGDGRRAVSASSSSSGSGAARWRSPPRRSF
jgi:hypothetical protein